MATTGTKETELELAPFSASTAVGSVVVAVRVTLRAPLRLAPSPTPAEEMTSIAWSYAALRHLDLDPAIVFHDDGYKGEAVSLIENFTAGHYFGVPLLQLYGMAVEPSRAAETGVELYPHMLRWLR